MTALGKGIALAWVAALTAAAQLPPQVELDRLLLRAEQREREMNFEGAAAALEEAGKLAQLEGLELPDAVSFRLASLALKLDRPADAVHFVTRYLQSADRDAEHYRDALGLIEKAEAEIARREAVERVRPSPESLCKNKQDQAECWIEIKRDCWLWNGDRTNLSGVEGSGECVNALAHGEWECTWKHEYWSYTGTGAFEAGRQTGRWVTESDIGQHRNEGPYRDGKKEGAWTERYFSASREPGHRSDEVSVGPYVSGHRHGFWRIRRDSDIGGPHWEVETGEYRDGVKVGIWKAEYNDGKIYTIPWVNGKEHGISEYREANGQLIASSRYRGGKRHGLEQWFDDDGKRTKWSCYEDGEETLHSRDLKKRKERENPPCE